MKLTFFLSISYLVIGCSNSEKPNDLENNSNSKPRYTILGKDTSHIKDSLKSNYPDKEVTITVSYAAIECGCPQWFETKFKDVKFLDGVERFYLERVNKDLVNANELWDGEHLPLTLKITGKFSKEKGLPITYKTKSEPEKARIFWYDKITIVSPTSR